MNDPLDLPLRDIHLPDAVAFWPLAYGWWILAGLILLVVALIIFIQWRNRRLRNSAIALAKNEFTRITSDYEKHNDPLLLTREISVLLRRLSISLFPRTEVASLTGEDWLAFLDQQLEGSPFSEGEGRILLDAQYRQSLEMEEVDKFINRCGIWIDKVTAKGSKRS